MASLVSVFLIFSCFSINALAEKSLKSDAFKRKVDVAINNAERDKNFSVDFKQEVYSALREKSSTSEGILTIKAPESFRFELISPYQELYVSNGQDFWKYVPRLKHAQHLKIASSEFSFINVLIDLSKIEKDYHIFQWNPPRVLKADQVAMKLIAKEDKDQKILYAIVDVKTGHIQELRIEQINGNWTQFHFIQYREMKFSEKMFLFVPPSGIVVNDMR